MTERPTGGESGPGTAPDVRDAGGDTPAGGPLKTAAEVAAARLAETAAEEPTTAPRTGEDLMAGGVAGVIRRHPAASLLIGLGVGLGVGWLVGRGKADAPTGA